MTEPRQRKVFTVGYGNRSPEQFVRVLEEHAVLQVVDVRLRPDRARLAAFALSKAEDKGIRALLKAHGICYVSFVELGNPFIGFEKWEARYRTLMAAASGLLLERLLQVEGDFALLCAEIDPKECHRSIIAEHLARHGRSIVHI